MNEISISSFRDNETLFHSSLHLLEKMYYFTLHVRCIIQAEIGLV